MSLQITRLRVEQLRRFRQPFELAGLAPGLNLITAPNEAGKSTLVRAIRAAFFERHRSTAVEDLRPWGEGSGAAPQVELDFLLDGQPHHLVKSFLGKKRCTLQVGTRTLDGTDAEDHLAQLFGFSFAGKGASKPEHWGIPGLLWVEQGTGQELDVSHARDHLHDALQGQVGAAAGALAASGGDALLEQLRAQRDELLTTAGKPRAALADAITLMATLEADLQALDSQIATYRQQVDQLTQLRQQHGADEAEQPWEALRQQLRQASQRQEELQLSDSQLQADQVRLQQLDHTRELLLKELDGLNRQHDLAQARQQALVQADAQLQQADAAVAQAAAQARQAAQRAEAARHTWRLARQEANRQQLQQHLQQAQAEATRSREALQRAEQQQHALAALRAAAPGTPHITREQVQRLAQLERAAREAQLQHQAVATRLQFRLPPGQDLTLQMADGPRTLQDQGEQLLDAPATLHLPGGGELTITPGGEDLASLARRRADTREALRQGLQALGVADLPAADARLAASTEREGQLKLAEQALAIVAPQGLEPLHAAHHEASQRIAAAQERLARLASPSDAAQDQPLPALDLAEAQQEAASATEQSASQALAEQQRRQAAVQNQHDGAQREHLAAQAALADPARQQRQAQAQQALLAQTAEHQALAARIAGTRAQLQQARPDIVAQDIARLQRSIEQQVHSHQQRREQILLLENTLQQAGAQGLEEQRQALAGQRAQAQRRHGELQRRAAALDLLCRMLDQKRQATLARLQAPLQQRLQHYLPLLLPGAAVQMDASLAPGLLTRASATGAPESGRVQDLSFGAREQLGLISRFAYADLLQQAGRPTLLILDDALVHSDAERLAQMKRVLFDAAQRHQVLLFTCHPASWRDLGVAPRTLE